MLIRFEKRLSNSKKFIFNKTIILKFFPFIGGAPLKIVIQNDIPNDGTRYLRSNNGVADDDSCQLRPETDADFDQSKN